MLHSLRMLSILLLGPPHLALDGQPLTAPRRKNRALLFVLAARDAPLSRDEALAFLWPDHPRPSAQRILRTMLSELRRQVVRVLSIPGVLLEGGQLSARGLAARFCTRRETIYRELP